MTLPAGAALGSTSDPRALIKGDPSRVSANATRFSDEATRVAGLAADVDAVAVTGWTGGLGQPAYAAARGRAQRKWTAYAELLQEAGQALTTYAAALTTAQSKAADAIAKWEEGEAATERAVAAHNAAVEAYNTYVNRQVCVAPYGAGPTTPSIGPSRPGPFVDPGEALRQEAEQILEDARTALDEAGMVAVETLGGLPGAKVEGSSGPGASASATGPSIDWGNWSRVFGDDKPGTTSTPGSESPFSINFGEVSAEAHAWGAEGSVEDYWGDVKVDASGKITVGGAEVGASGKIDADGLTAEARASVVALKLEGSAGLEAGYAEVGVSAEASAEATAEGSVTIGRDGVHAGGELFAGAKVEASVNGDVGGVGGEAKVEGWAGVGASADLDIGMTDGKFEIGGSAGAGLGLGGKVEFHLTIDPVEVFETGSDIIEGIGELFK